MFKTLFKRLLVTYLAIIIGIITILSMVITMIYEQYVFDEKQKDLENTAYKVSQLVNGLDKKNITSDQLSTSLDSMGYITDSKIYVVRVDKSSLENKSIKLGEELEDNYLIKDLRKILDGKKVFRRDQYSKNFDMYVVFVGVPWKDDTGICGAILLFSPVNEIKSNIAMLNLIIWCTAVVFIAISAVIIYFNSQRISRPIKEMEQAAGRLASGEDSSDIAIDSQDEIGNLAKTFNYMKRQLADTEKMRREFIANVSHDLRTPLTSIRGFVEGMLDGLVKPQDYNKYLNIIKEETDRLTRLTSEILQLAKIQSGSIKLFKEELCVRDIIDVVMNSAAVLAKEKNISVSADCDKAIYINADSDKLKQILVNIIGNAIKYTREGGVVHIRAREKGGKVEFSVKDTGIGIPEEELPFIFEKFYRVDKSRQSHQGGTGLGLNIVKGLVELHGGKIWATSQLGSGTEIIFELRND